MFDKKNKLRLLDFIDINILQKFQDAFSNAMGFASIMVDDEGSITKPSNFTDFCIKYTRGSEEGYKRCTYCDIMHGKVASEKGAPIIYDCHTGLTDFAVPIIVDGKHIASILGGQILTKEPDEEKFRKIARELGIDEEQYIEALKKIKITSFEKVRLGADLLFLVANSISEIAHKNFELKEKNKQESIYRHIMNTVRGSLDISVVKHEMVTQLGILFGADRVAFADYNKAKGDYFISSEGEYRSSPNVKSFVGYNFSAVPGFVEGVSKLHMSGQSIIFSDLDKYLEDNNLKGTPLEVFYREMGFMSSIAINIFYGKIFYGDLVITFEEKREIEERDVEFIKLLANQAGIALYQAELYLNIQEKVKREVLLRNIITAISGTLDIKEVKKMIINKIVHVLNPDRVHIIEFDNIERKYIPVDRDSEYRASDDFRSYVGLDISEMEDFKAIQQLHLSGSDMIYSDREDYIRENNFERTPIADTLRNFKIKSLAAICIWDGNNFIGNIVIEYLKEPVQFTDEDINFLQVIKEETGIALKQANLYKLTQEHAQREALLRSIIETVRATLELHETKQKIVEMIGKTLRADRCFIIEYDKRNDKFLIINEEYLSSNDIISCKNIDINENVPHFSKLMKEGKRLVINESTIQIEDEKVEMKEDEFYQEIQSMKDCSVHSALIFPLNYSDKFLGDLVLHYVDKAHHAGKDEVEFLTLIANQIAIAYHQAELYSKIKEKAEREALLRELTSAISSTFDITEIVHTFVFEIGKILKAQKVFFSNYNELNNTLLTPDEKFEYRESSDIVKYKDMDEILDNNFPYFADQIKTGKDLRINDIQKLFKDKGLENSQDAQSAKKYNFNTAISFPVVFQGKLLGFYGIEYEKSTVLSQENVEFLTILSQQTVIAMHQSKLYSTIKEKAEREAFIRSLIEVIRSTLDASETKQKIVDIVGKSLKVDRCFILEYDKKNDKFLTIDEEYLSSKDIKPYKGVNLNEHIPNAIVEFKKGKSLVLNEESFELGDDEFDIYSDKFEKEKTAKDDYNITSALVFPLHYYGEFLGDLVIHSVDESHKIGEDEIEFLNIIVNQVAIALHQSKLYEKIQLQAERERISRNIIEILRSTLDKNIIKHLFVKSIGKYFNADRVFFSEYDPEAKKYLPVDENSEYRSSPECKSLVGYDLSNPYMLEHLQPLLDKRELNIAFVDEDIKNNKIIPEIALFYEKSKVKSSYKFPVLYEGKIMGFFGLGFINKVYELSDEDIVRIRSICTQAGIALYHADLYMKAQEAASMRNKIIGRVSNGIKDPVDNIIKHANFMIGFEFERDIQLEYLDNIIKSCNQLIDLTRNIIEESSE